MIAEEGERQLVSVERVLSCVKHPNADRLNIVKIKGWQVVTTEWYEPGDRAIFLELDSFVPVDREPFKFLEKNKTIWNNKEGVRIKTIRLRGELSQGLVLPLSESAFGDPDITDEKHAELLKNWWDIVKWEPNIPANLAGKVRGNFPGFLRKTDQERLQNMWRDVHRGDLHFRPVYEVTVKMDGSSMTVYRKDGRFGVCSRNLDLLETEDNSFWQTARKLCIEERMIENELDNIAIQGELMGPGVNKNHEGLKELDFFVFDIYDIHTASYIAPWQRRNMASILGLSHVPLLDDRRRADFATIEDALAFAEGPSFHANMREGVVFKSIDNPNFSFKIISNQYLLTHEDA